MKVFGELERAQFELIAGNPTGGGIIEGRAWYNTVRNLLTYRGTSANLEVVDTTSTQTLTNKTLTSPTISGSPSISGATIATSTLTSPIINGANFNYGTATDTNRLILPDGSTSVLDALANTLGLLAYDTDKLKPVYNNGSTWEAIGGGGGGGIDIIKTQDFESEIKAANVITGLHATFGTAGSFDGAVSDETSSPLQGTTSLKYVAGASSTNDWIEIETITFDPRTKGEHIGITCYVDMSGFTKDVDFVVLTNEGDILTDSGIDIFTASTAKSRYSFSVFVPSTATSITYGIHMVNAPVNTETILLDAFEFSLNPFTYKKLVNITDWESTTLGGTWAVSVTQNVYKRRVGDTLEVQGSFTLTGTPSGTLTLILPDSLVIDTAKLSSITSNLAVGVANVMDFSDSSRARTSGLAADVGGQNAIRVKYNNSTTLMLGWGNGNFVPGSPISFTTGDIIHFSFSVPITGWTATTEHLITPVKSGIEYYNADTHAGYGSTNTKIPRLTNVRKNTISQLGSLDSDEVVNGWSFTASKKVIVFINGSKNSSASGASNWFGISINSNQLTTDIVGIDVDDRKDLDYTNDSNSSAMTTTSYIGVLDINDVLRLHGDGSAASVNGRSHLSLVVVSFEQMILSALPILNPVAFIEDRKSLTTDGGTSSITPVARDLNTISGDPSVNISLDGTDGWIINDSGVYLIEWSAPAAESNRHMSALKDESTGAGVYIKMGTNAFSLSSTTVDTRSTGSWYGQIAAGTSLAIYHEVEASKAGNGWGESTNAALSINANDYELYTTVKVIRLR